MKVAAIVLSFLPAALAVTCAAESGCAGCGQVAWPSFVESGGKEVATAAGWATMTVSGSTIALENVSGSTLTVCNYGVVCYYISPHSDCTVGVPSGFNTEIGMQVWQHP
ncbi:hypothetical protein UCREL1_2877 [Eutypa lata UCREL1]|uniref:Secreted protein n=1 Tax=Eutypa lata (strain UCR-EL1) TaxID=1287681 RepID=M7SZX3_EUTLA|nr:hypothetical protein UCREL1_2877 [Eutypa lata UCREL1]